MLPAQAESNSKLLDRLTGMRISFDTCRSSLNVRGAARDNPVIVTSSDLPTFEGHMSSTSIASSVFVRAKSISQGHWPARSSGAPGKTKVLASEVHFLE